MKGVRKKSQKRIKSAATQKWSDYVPRQNREELELENESLLQAQMELESSRERYAEFFDAAPVCFVTLTRSGIIREINRPGIALLDHKHLVGWPFVSFIAKEDQRIFLAHLSRCRDNSNPMIPMSVELRLKCRTDENPVFIKFISTPASNARETIFKSVFINVTDQKEAEKKLQESLMREKTAREAAEAAGQAKDSFLAALSHELRTPLNPVLLVASDAAANRELSPGVRASFNMIRRNVEMEARLIDDLLDLTRVTAGKLKLEKRHVNVHAILKNVISLLQTEIDQKGIVLKQNFEAFQTIVFGDAVRLQQIFWNVLKNAIKFTPSNGTITVQTASTTMEFSVSISDTGIGMTEAELNRAFDAFAQGEHSKDFHRFGGLGLGLAISKKLAEFHAGAIEAVSKGRDCGSTFTIKFPLAGLNELVSKNDPPPAKQSAPPPGIHILLVEDHEPTRMALANILTRRHYSVKMAVSVREALALAEKNDFGIVISDIGLPDGNGYDLFKKLRKQSNIKGIALTGYGMDDDVARSHDAGFATHLIKPVRIESLNDALITALKDER